MSRGSKKIVGVGLNRTGTKTLKRYFEQWGFRHMTYDLDAFNRYRRGEIEELLAEMEHYDSFEDWPWPLMFRQIDAHFPDALFVLTVRQDAQTWFRSLCNLAVRMGPLKLYEKHIYGYAMPQGKRQQHLEYYRAHNAAVEEHFAGRPEKLLKICWEESRDVAALADFVGRQAPPDEPHHANRSSRRIYNGNNLWLAHANRIVFQAWWYGRAGVRKLGKRLLGHR